MTTVYEAFRKTVELYPENSCLAVPARPQREYLAEGIDLTYRQVHDEVLKLADAYRKDRT